MTTEKKPRNYSPKKHMFYIEFTDSEGKAVVLEWRRLTEANARSMHNTALKKMRIYIDGQEVATHRIGWEESK